MASTPPNDPARTDREEGDAMGEEPEIESGAGYGNHAPDAGAGDPD